MWITSEPLSEKEAKKALREALPDIDRYLKKRQIEIVPHEEWYLKEGTFNIQRVLNTWIDKYNQALAQGYDGLRLTVNLAWLEERDWRNFIEYEEKVNNVIDKYKIMAICTYSLDKCGASEVIDVVSTHQFALRKREANWELMLKSKPKEGKETRAVETTEKKKLGNNRELMTISRMKYNLMRELGKKILDIRLTRKVSLRDLEKHTGLSRSFLSQVEHGKTSPSISSLEKIAGALNTPLGHFFEGEFPKRISIIKKKKEKKFVAENSKAFYEILVPNIFSPTISPVLFTLKLGGKLSKSQLEAFKEERFIYVLKGKIELACLKGNFILEEGDSVYCKCDASCRKMSNVGNKEATVLWVMRTPST
ncbi:hypothetical protein LCGC14_0688690 [marine sediment metagenome]|uniref:HTH cro/C1-type domain-containing protein n=1 Tax=marine sediment metagenome TaxID=412755 RepID=A0A0F9R6H5_9ZZZZ|nr:helix-turn-helix domain-containing protein [Candidatus Aminicenantes bacterium]